jgi:lipoate---protein ligase
VTAASWSWEHRRGPADALHDTSPPDELRPTAWMIEVEEPSLVLGSTQASDDIDAGRAREMGVRIVRRRSGGGGVLLVPGQHVWIDVWVPAGSRWWDDDVVRAGDWLGAVWVDALREVGLEDLAVHHGALVRSRWSSSVCFAGLGPGEVTARGRKLVGLSQRRTRDWARFQCLVHRRWDAEAVFALLDDPEARSAGPGWETSVAAIGGRDIGSAFAAALSQA